MHLSTATEAAVRNEGDKTSKGIQLLVREPAGIAIDSDSIKATVQSGLPVSVAPERHIMTGGKYAYVSFALPDMHPGQTAEIDEPIVVMNSTVQGEFRAVSKDGAPVSAGFSMIAGLPITVSIAGEDLRTVDYDLELMGIKANTKEELVAAFKEEVRKERETHRKMVGFWRDVLDRPQPTRAPCHGLCSCQHSERRRARHYSGDGHLITFAPTGTGKTSGPVITNALAYVGKLY